MAVIGPTGEVPFVSGGGSAHVLPDEALSPLAAIRAWAGRGGRVSYALGEDLFGRVFLEQTVAAGAPYSHDEDITLDAPDEWTLLIQYTGAHTDRPKVLLDGTELFPLVAGYAEYFSGGLISTTPEGLNVRRKTVRLTASKHTLRITADGGTEGRIFKLANAAVSAANPRTVVVLNTSSASAMPWLSRTAAALQMYYPGQEGGPAAALLFGDANPGGRLTQTFPVSDDRTLVSGDPHRYPGADGEERYSEGIHTGYRWYDAEGVTPLFPSGTA